MNFEVLSMEFHVTNRLPFLFQTDGKFYQNILSHTFDRVPCKSLIKKKALEVKLLERLKVYYCFYSKGDNFKVSQL